MFTLVTLSRSNRVSGHQKTPAASSFPPFGQMTLFEDLEDPFPEKRRSEQQPNTKRPKNAFFMTKQEKREHFLALKQLEHEKQRMEAAETSRQFNLGKQLNPFFAKREFQTKKTLSRPQIEAPWPDAYQSHVGYSNRKLELCEIPFVKSQIRVDDPLDYVFPKPSESVQKEEVIVLEDVAMDRIGKCIGHLECMKQQMDDPVDPQGLWTEFYAPQSCNQWIGPNKRTSNTLKDWLLTWTPQTKKKQVDSDESEEGDYLCCCILGPIKSGKTQMVYTVASECQYQVLEVNCSTKRSGKDVMELVSEAMSSHRLGTSKTLVLFDDVDIILEPDKGFWSTLQQLVKTSKCPILMTATMDPFYKSNTLLNYNFWKSHVQIHNLEPPSTKGRQQYLQILAGYRGCTLGHRLLSHLSNLQLGDAVNKLQGYCPKQSNPYLEIELPEQEHPQDTDFLSLLDMYQPKQDPEWIQSHLDLGNLPPTHSWKEERTLTYSQLDPIAQATIPDTLVTEYLPYLSLMAQNDTGSSNRRHRFYLNLPGQLR
ncbi:P-loop containing nucleoside triphosphate hydrolase protein, partial [Gorgonomyces haynaldii]